MKRLVLVRHGESHWNAEGRIQGQRCGGLSATGWAQAELTAEFLGRQHPGARLIASDLLRTRQTAEPLARVLGTGLETDERLRERSFGVWEGRLRTEVTEGDPQRWERWLTGEDVTDEIGGETAEQLVARVDPRLRALLADTPVGGVTIAVTHGGPVWHGTHRLLGLAVPSLGAVGNASVTEILELDGGTLVLDRWNELAHLPIDVRTTGRPRNV